MICIQAQLGLNQGGRDATQRILPLLHVKIQLHTKQYGKERNLVSAVRKSWPLMLTLLRVRSATNVAMRSIFQFFSKTKKPIFGVP